MTITIFLACSFCAVVLGALIRRGGRSVSLEQWALGGRRFSTAFVFMLMAGEIYTTFTFLGTSGFAYGKGGAVFYILTYTCFGFVVSYWLLPPVWRYASDNCLVTQPDFFEKKYRSQELGMAVTVVGLAALIFYLILQLRGLGIIAETLSGGRIAPSAAVGLGAIVMALYVISSGMRGSAWASVVKDSTTWLICGFLGIYLPYHYYGGIGGMFKQIELVRPGFSALPNEGETPVWYCSTVALSALGLYMWPHTFSSAYTSRSAITFRKNAVFMPIYALFMMFAMLVGFVAALQVPGLQGSQVDLALLKLSMKTFEPEVVAIIGAAGVLTALVPGSTILIVGSTLISNNVIRKLSPAISDEKLTTLARGSVLLLTSIAVFFTLMGSASIVPILIMGYSIVTQLFPALFLSLLPVNPITKEGALAGLIVGVGTVAVVATTGLTISSFFPSAPAVAKEINPGFIALTLNVVVALLVSAVTAKWPTGSTR